MWESMCLPGVTSDQGMWQHSEPGQHPVSRVGPALSHTFLLSVCRPLCLKKLPSCAENKYLEVAGAQDGELTSLRGSITRPPGVLQSIGMPSQSPLPKQAAPDGQGQEPGRQLWVLKMAQGTLLPMCMESTGEPSVCACMYLCVWGEGTPTPPPHLVDSAWYCYPC